MPLGKVFNRELDESDQKEEILKTLKNIEGKNKDQLDAIKDQREKQLEAIKDQGEKQSDAIGKQKKKKELIEKIKRNRKIEKIVFLKDELSTILLDYTMCITRKGEDILKKLADEEKVINYGNLF